TLSQALRATAVWTFATPPNGVRSADIAASGRGGLNHGGIANNICWRIPPGLNLFAQKCHRVLTRRAPGGVAPLWEQFIVIGALWSVGLQDAQEHYAVGCDHQCRDTRHAQIRPDLCLTHSKDALFVAMVDFNLPTIEVGLQKFFGAQLVIVAQQVGFFAVVEMACFGLAIRDGRHDKEAQKPSTASPLPEHLADFLEADPAVFGAVKDFGLFPRDSGVFRDRFGTEKLCSIVATTLPLMGKTEPQVFASSRNEDRAIQRLAEGRFIAEGAIAHGNELLVCKTMGVKVLP